MITPCLAIPDERQRPMRTPEDPYHCLPDISHVKTDEQAYPLLPPYTLPRKLYVRYRDANCTPQEALQKVLADWRKFWKEINEPK